MDEADLSGLILLLALIAAQALLTLAYAALSSSRRGALEEQVEAGDRRAEKVLRLIQITVRLRITYQITALLIHAALMAVAITRLAQPLLETMRADNPSVRAFPVYLAVLLPTVLAALVFGDLMPSALGSARPIAVARWAAAPFGWLVFLLRPVVAPLYSLRRALLNAFGGDNIIGAITEEEIMSLIEAGQKGGTIETEEKRMIYSVLQLDNTMAREVMVPRIDMVALEIDEPIDVALDKIIESGHSRIPVFEENIDNLKGVLYAKDLLGVLRDGDAAQHTIAELLRPAYFVHETKPADELLRELKSRKVHIALVVDEYGGTAGLVTIENLIEEIVGDIQDEYDTNEEAEYTQVGLDAYTIDGSMDLDDLNNLLGCNLPTDDSDTLGGFIYTQLGRVPEVGEVVESDGLTMEIKVIDGRRIRKVDVARRPMEDDGERLGDNVADETGEAVAK